MLMSDAHAQQLAQKGIAALQRGDAGEARKCFKTIADAGLADASIYLALAIACRALRDTPAAIAAVDLALAADPQNIRALNFKADHLDANGDTRAASAYYGAVINIASQNEKLPVDLHRDVQHAQAMRDRYGQQFDNFLQSELVKRGLNDGASTRRFRQSLDLLAGRKARYVQEPRVYFFPELPQIQFFERADFPWLDHLEASTAVIRAELIAVMKEAAAFQPYVEARANRPRQAQGGMVNNPDWSAFYLWRDGAIVERNAARCPETMAALSRIPLTRVANRSPSVLFSLMRPGSHIPAHNGFVNTRLIGHLPLIVPPRCRFRVGNEEREWVEGKAWVFDDTIEHEAWNDSEETRVILLFEIWRPELTIEERGLVAAMFEAIDTHSGTTSAWNF